MRLDRYDGFWPIGFSHGKSCFGRPWQLYSLTFVFSIQSILSGTKQLLEDYQDGKELSQRKKVVVIFIVAQAGHKFATKAKTESREGNTWNHRKSDVNHFKSYRNIMYKCDTIKKIQSALEVVEKNSKIPLRLLSKKFRPEKRSNF